MKSGSAIKQLDGATIFSTPLEEYYYASPEYLDYLKNKHFHNSHKGCDTEMVINKCKDGNLSVNMICHTHNVTCSKTGWELGWYLGTKSRADIYRKVNCCDCGKEIETKSRTFKRCSACKIIATNKRTKDRLKNICH